MPSTGEAKTSAIPSRSSKNLRCIFCLKPHVHLVVTCSIREDNDDVSELDDQLDELMGGTASFMPPPAVPNRRRKPVVASNASAASSSTGSARSDYSRSAATVSIDLGSATLGYYHRHKRFQLHCRASGHGATCKLSRGPAGVTTDDPLELAACTDDQLAAGRPLGLMTAWYLHNDVCNDHDTHISAFFVATLTFDMRVAARQWLMIVPNAADLFQYERKQREHEGEEPVGLAGFA